MQDDGVADNQRVLDARNVNPAAWVTTHERSFALVFEYPKLPLEKRLEAATKALEGAARFSDRPRVRRCRMRRRSVLLWRLLKPTEAVHRALAEMFGEGTPLWAMARFMRRLWRKARFFAHQNAQHYVHAQFYVWALRRRHRMVCHAA